MAAANVQAGTSLPITLRRRLARTRFKPLLILTALCLVVQEQYPFSDFPMYASIGPTSSYLYLVDGEGAPVGTLSAIGVRAPSLKKVFGTALQKEADRLHVRPRELTAEQRKAIGENLLRELRNAPAARAPGRRAPAVLRLYEVNIALRSGRYERETTMIAEVR